MGCTITVSLVAERQDGPIGDDWRYALEAKAFNDGLKDKGVIEVPEHRLSSGQTQAPPGPPEPLVLDAGRCRGDMLVRLAVDATEVDVLAHDRGSTNLDVNMTCPGEGAEPVSRDVEVSVGVVASPGISGETSVFRLVVRLVAECA